jgi:hypothetical protein
VRESGKADRAGGARDEPATGRSHALLQGLRPNVSAILKIVYDT